MQQQSSGAIRIIFLERIGAVVIPLTVLYALAIGILGFSHPVPSAATVVLNSLVTLAIGIVASIGGGMGLGAMGGAWGGGFSGFGYSGYSYTDPLATQGTMGSGLQTQNQPVGTPPTP